MSGTTADPKLPEPLITGQFIIGIFALVILTGTLVGVFLIKDLSPLQGTIAGSVVTGTLGAVLQFYFGSSKGSQAKDQVLAQQVPTAPLATTTTTVTPPATTTITTPP